MKKTTLTYLATALTLLTWIHAGETETGSEEHERSSKIRIADQLDGEGSGAEKQTKALSQFRIYWTRVTDGEGRRNVVNRVVVPTADELPNVTEPEHSGGSIVSRDNVLKHKGMLNVSATVFGAKYSLLKWQRAGRHYEAISNVDFNHLAGFSTFQAEGARYGVNLFIESAVLDRAAGAKFSRLPDLETAGASYLLVKGGKAKGSDVTRLIDLLHKLYDVEKNRLIAAHQVRKQKAALEQKRKDVGIDNPEAKPDLIINYWKRSTKKTQP